jgi:hypothetical protein
MISILTLQYLTLRGMGAGESSLNKVSFDPGEWVFK